MSRLVYLMHTIWIRRLLLQYMVLPSLAGTFRLMNQLCSRKLFLGPGPIAGTFRVSRVCCIGLIAYGGTMLFAQPLLHAVRLPCLRFNHRFGIRLLEHFSSKREYTDFCWDYSLHPISEREGGYTGWSAAVVL